MGKQIGRIVLVATVLTGLIVFLTTCVTPQEAKQSPQIPADEIRIGIVVPLTGAVPSFGIEVRNGVLLAVKEWNARGGVGGRRIVTFIEDGQCKASQGVQAVQKLIAADRVHYLIGEVCSVASIPISEIANGAKVIQISPTSTNPRVTVDTSGTVKRYIFRNCFIDPYQGLIGAKFVYNNLGARTAFLMGDPMNNYVSGLKNAFEVAFTRLGGKIVGKVGYSGGQTDFSAILSEIQAAKPDVVYLPDYYNVVNLVTRQAKERGLSIPFVGGDGWDSTDLDLDATEGSYFDNHFSDQDPRPEVELFLDTYERTFPNDERAVGVRHMIAALAYDAANMLVQAIKDAGSDDTTRVSKALESIHFHGVTGDLAFDASHDPMKTAYMYAIRNHAVQFVDRIDP